MKDLILGLEKQSLLLIFSHRAGELRGGDAETVAVEKP